MSNPNRNVKFEFSFLGEKKYSPFLKKDDDLNTKYCGQPLNELISIPNTDFPGIRLEKDNIPVITEDVYQKILQKQNDLCVLKNSEIILFLYTLCKLDDIVLFNVLAISTEICYESRETWEEFYNIGSNACCKYHYSLISKNSTKINAGFLGESCRLNTVDLDLLIEKKCIFKKPYIKVNSFVFSHFFNTNDQEIVETINDYFFNIPVCKNFTLSNIPHPIKFCYGGVENVSSLTCDLLYDEISFQNTSIQTCEHNFKNFISDSLHTSFYYQKNIDNFPFGFLKKDQRLLYLSIYI